MPLRCDLIIRDATLFDGTGGPRATGDVGVSGDRIVAVGDLSAASADREVVATGKALAPASSTRTPTTTAPCCAARSACAASRARASRRWWWAIAA
jgi:hypothetical protein